MKKSMILVIFSLLSLLPTKLVFAQDKEIAPSMDSIPSWVALARNRALVSSYVGKICGTQDGTGGKIACINTTDGKFFPPEDVATYVFGHFRKGESCIEAFKRIGYFVNVSDCIAAAEKAHIPVLWHRPNLYKPATYIVAVQAGATFGIKLYPNGKRDFLLSVPKELKSSCFQGVKMTDGKCFE